MKCPKCVEGEFRAKGSGMRKRTGFFTRYRVCNKCGYKVRTVEIPYDTYEAENVLMKQIVDAVNEYATKKEPVIENA